MHMRLYNMITVGVSHCMCSCVLYVYDVFIFVCVQYMFEDFQACHGPSSCNRCLLPLQKGGPGFLLILDTMAYTRQRVFLYSCSHMTSCLCPAVLLNMYVFTKHTCPGTKLTCQVWQLLFMLISFFGRAWEFSCMGHDCPLMTVTTGDLMMRFRP